MTKTIHLISAARPNFMKIAPLYHALKNEPWCNVAIIHTGQHYDYLMSQTFFDDFELPQPQHYLGIGRGTHAEQTAQTMIAYEKICLEKESPDLVVVVGDVNATLACSITAKKLNLLVAHLEAGLRSRDKSMPEEINRIVTDSISDYFWTPSNDANNNLIREGIDKNKIFLVGNIMIDTYHMMHNKIKKTDILAKLQLKKKEYALLTLHRPINVDCKVKLQELLQTIATIDIKFIFPIHPRTKKTFTQLADLPKNITMIDPQNYINFMSLIENSKFVLTDSGGIQEETTYLQIPCFTLRDNTERPITIDIGSNQLVNTKNLQKKIHHPKKGLIPSLWDGKTAFRLIPIIKRILQA